MKAPGVSTIAKSYSSTTLIEHEIIKVWIDKVGVLLSSLVM